MNDIERKFLLCVERGDLDTLRNLLGQEERYLDINCTDPLARNALIIAIDNENLEMVKILIDAKIFIGDALLYAISVNFVEAVELLLDHEERFHQPGQPHSWEQVNENSSFSGDMTPLILAAHMNNFEIIKILMDRGVPPVSEPHDPRCDCAACCLARSEDCLKHSRSRMNAYRALASPCLMALSSSDPLLTAFQLSSKLENLVNLEPEYKQDYLRLRSQCQTFATKLLDHARTSQELEILLNHSDEQSHETRLARLRLAIQCKQKTFCAHPNIQELLATMWYENLPGFRRRNIFAQIIQVILIGIMFPVLSVAYLIAPESRLGRYIKKPFIKFICHSASYITFLIVLILASQRVEAFYCWDSILGLFWQEPRLNIVTSDTNGTFIPRAPDLPTLVNVYKQEVSKHSSARGLESLTKMFDQLPASSKKRGLLPSPIEMTILMWVISLLWAEIKQLRALGMNYYKADMWNTLDSVASVLYIGTIILRIVSYLKSDESTIAVAREHWDAYDPTLLSEGLFAAATIFSALKLVYIFSVNPYLGPLQISLGRMIIDILRFSWIYMLVLFSFACGMNQLLWYYADLERHQCLNITNYSLAQYYSAQYDQTAKQGDPLKAELSSLAIGRSLSNQTNQSEVRTMESAFNASLDDDSSKPPVTLDDSCKTWRHFSNVFESSQTLFWATFGLVDLENFELTGIRQYTRFWALLMFGCYCFINVIVVLNLLIAMMNLSYDKISKKSDIEWKFARTRLWMSYFDTGSTVPAPFNTIPSVKSVLATIRLVVSKLSELFEFFRGSGSSKPTRNDCRRKEVSKKSHWNKLFYEQPKRQTNNSADQSLYQQISITRGGIRLNTLRTIAHGRKNFRLTANYFSVMRSLVRRYLVNEQRLLEKKRELTEAKLNRWAKLNAFAS